MEGRTQEDEPMFTARSLDDYLESASHQSSAPSDPYVQWRYWLIFISLGVANSSDASEILCLSYLLSEPNFKDQILADQAWRGGLLASTVFLGMLFGGLIVGALGDYKGRRPLLLIGLATNCVCGILSACAFDVFFLSFLRLLAGLGIGATVPPLFTLCSELAPPADRGFWVSVAAAFWMVGSIYVAVVGWWLLGVEEQDASGTSGGGHNMWRVFAIACALPSACGTYMVWKLVPESPRFLVLQGRYEQAASVAHQLAQAMQYIGLPLMVEELRQIYPQHASTLISTTSEDSSFLSLVTVAFGDFYQAAARLYTPSLRGTTWPLQMIWFTLSFGSYGLLTWINRLFVLVHLQNVYANALLFAASNLPGNILSALLMDRTGRASMLSGSLLAAAFSLLVFAFVAFDEDTVDDEAAEGTTHGHRAVWIVLAACCFQCFSIAAWNAIDVLSTELFPTTVRATAVGLCAASGRVGAMVAQFVNGYLVVQHPGLLLVTAATALLLGAVTPILLPRDMTGEAVQDYLADAIPPSEDGDAVQDGPLSRRKSSSYAYERVDPDSTTTAGTYQGTLS